MAGLTVLDGNRVFVADGAGDATVGNEGLYADDVRMLSRWRLTVNGRTARSLGTGREDGHFTAQRGFLARTRVAPGGNEGRAAGDAPAERDRRRMP